MMRDYVAYTAATFRFSREIPVILIDLCNDIYIFDYLDLNRTGSTHLSSLQLLLYACLAPTTVVIPCKTYKKTSVSVMSSRKTHKDLTWVNARAPDMSIYAHDDLLTRGMRAFSEYMRVQNRADAP